MGSDASAWPLVIDLDGTLLKTNALGETFLDTLRTNPLALARVPLEFVVGHSSLKAYLAQHSPLDVEAWPFREDFLEFAKRHSNAGRHVVLATAADEKVADAIATRLAFIGEVIASTDGGSLKGKEKARRLHERFPDGYIYAGSSASDLEIWGSGGGCILVGASPSVVRRACALGQPLAIFPRRPIDINAFLRGLRLQQWAKNALIFVPLVLGGKAADANAWLNALLGFLAFGFAASATYLVNDLFDLPSDRKHWSKRLRPLASGDLSIRSALLLAIAGLAVAFAMAEQIGPRTLAILGVYVALTLSYSFSFKRVPLLDVLVLASLFTLRLGFGIAITDVRLSPWILVFSIFVFLSLSAAKRHTEVLRMAERGVATMPGRGYVGADAPVILGFGTASALSAVLITVLYLIEDAFHRQFYSRPAILWAIPPILFLFLGRIWLLSQRGQLHDDPVTFALNDRTSLALGVLMGAAVAAAMLW